jgi:L-amino acid N-acyltransferase YncA
VLPAVSADFPFWSRAVGLHSAPVIVRRAVPADAGAVAAIYGPIVLETAISFEEVPPGADEIRRRMSSSIVWLVCEDAGEVLGYGYAAAFHPRAAYRWSAEVSIYIAGAARGGGRGRGLLIALLDDLRGRGYVNAFAGIALPNDASVRLFESHGFERIAQQKGVGYKLGRWHDVGWWQLRLREPEVPPGEPA